MFEIIDVRFEDQGMIACQAENVFGTRVAHVKLIVFGEYIFSLSVTSINNLSGVLVLI